MDELEARVENELGALPTLEEAAQRFVEILFATFEESLVLARLFATVPFSRLPLDAQSAVRGVAQGTGQDTIADSVPVLTLLGTRGMEADWNDRRRSRGHAGIPLGSPDFVEAIPMIASLMRQLGVAVWGVGLDTAIVTQSIGSVAGVFYVDDARTTVDGKGRRVISAQAFVEQYDVRTVFGFGGTYTLRGMFMATVLFTREELTRVQAERFMRLANSFKARTMRLALRGRVFKELG